MAKSTTFRWGILGCANIGRKFVPAVQKLKGAKVLACASRSFGKAEAYAKEFGIPRAYGSYEELLRDPEIDAIYNPLPNDLHCPWSIKAMQAGKHVLCEKPLALTAAEVKRMIDASKRCGVLLMEAFMYRLHPQWDLVLRTIKSGQIGEPRVVIGTFSFAWNLAVDNDRLHPEQGGGALLDVGCYCVNAARTVFGAEPSRVSATQHLSKKLGIDMTTCGLLEFPGGRVALFDSSFEINGRWGVDIECTGGHMHIPKPWLSGDQPAQIMIRSGGKQKTLIARVANSYGLEAAHLADCARTGKRLRFPPSESLAQMKVLNAIQRAARTGKAVSL